MSNPSEAEVIQLLADAQRAGGKPTVDPAKLAHLNLDAAYRVSLGQQDLFGEKVALYKTAVRTDGSPGVASPIWASRVGQSGPEYVFPAHLDVKGLEFEVGVVLSQDIEGHDDLDEDAIEAAVDHYFLGIEVVGTRLAPTANGEKPSPAQSLADHNSALGYVFGGRYTKGRDVSGMKVTLEIDGKEIDRKPAVPGCGTVLASVVAYAKAQHPGLPLKAGTVITTGALSGCVLLPEGAKGLVVGRLGDEEPVKFTLQ
ncbi:hypothetical protein F5X68DRAFT_198515 [Plectosphaerella plurivora]|uniref:Fumarylacetoacetase-like C-terminal domain-containing protein n=1 Tax=Plectosphaerella plurivora TaxID=936078 RepID=A0A9P9AGE1_9PEZI|nr:hypothetical protein F5X68DRAFT_198515 [Plectosphaerella plurivora]